MGDKDNIITLTKSEYDRMKEAQFMVALVESVIHQEIPARTKCVTIDNMLKMLERI